MKRLFLGLLGSMSCALMAACDDIGSPRVPQVAAIEIIPASPLITGGDTVDFTAVARDRAGDVIPDARIRWSSSDPGSIEVNDSTGRVVVHHGRAAWLSAAVGTVVEALQITPCSSNREPTGVRLVAFNIRPGAFQGPVAGDATVVHYDGHPLLFSGELVFGTTVQDFVWTRRQDVALAPHGVCSITLPNGEYTRTNVVYSGPTVPSLKIEQETFAPTVAGFDGILLMRYTFTNAGATAISGLRAGMLLDWDVVLDTGTDYTQNYSRMNLELNAAEAYQPGLQTGGIASTNTPITSYSAFPVRNTPQSTESYFNLLNGDVNESGPIGPDDIGQVVGFGPFNLLPGQSEVVEMAFTAGYTRSEFETAVLRARTIADAFPHRLMTAE